MEAFTEVYESFNDAIFNTNRQQLPNMAWFKICVKNFVLTLSLLTQCFRLRLTQPHTEASLSSDPTNDILPSLNFLNSLKHRHHNTLMETNPYSL